MTIAELDIVDADRCAVSSGAFVSIGGVFTYLRLDGSEPEHVVCTHFGFCDGRGICEELRSGLISKDDSKEDHEELCDAVFPFGDEFGSIPEAEANDKEFNGLRKGVGDQSEELYKMSVMAF